MRSAIATSIYAIKIVKELSDKLDLDLHGEVIISVTPDGETDGLAGAEYLVGKGIFQNVNYTITPEPTSLTYIWHAHKGCLWYKVRVRGKQAHATLLHLGINAFEKMIQLAMEFIE